MGADVYGSILKERLRKGAFDEPVAQNTVFGWILFGSCPSNCKTKLENSREYKLTHSLHTTVTSFQDHDLQKFWEIEELPTASTLTEDESRCESLFVSTHYRLPDERYVVRLPFRDNVNVNLGDSLNIALKSFSKLEHRLSKDIKLYEDYSSFLREYLSLGHMTQLKPMESSKSPAYYMPHHPIIREVSSTSPLRVVFNASSHTSNGVSLNDILLPGQKLQNDLPSILLRWRTHRLVYITDIAKMFRQILIHPSDADLQRIVWRFDPIKFKD